MTTNTQVVQKYLSLRESNDIPELLKLFASGGMLIDTDNNSYAGGHLKTYYEINPPPSVKPSISEPVVDKNENITLTLTFLFIKTIQVKFEFENNLIKKLTLSKTGLF